MEYFKAHPKQALKREPSRVHSDRSVSFPPREAPLRKSGEMTGHAFEWAGICASCKDSLRGTYYTRQAQYSGFAEPICCRCGGCEGH